MITMPILDNKKITSIVQVGSSLADFDETMRKLLIIMIISIPTSISVAIIVGYFMAKKSLKPVDQITAATMSISVSSLSERLPVPPRIRGSISIPGER